MEEAKANLELILEYFSEFTPHQLQQFAALEELYKDWNSKINVISRKDIDSLYVKHVLHSLSIATLDGFKPGTAILDIGTGGGFPGIPLAIFYPEVTFHLADSIGKKIKVVEEVVSALGLKNVTVQQTRVEDIKNRKFDFTVSRAVAPLKDLWNWSKPLLRKSAISNKTLQNESNNLQENHTLPGLICLKGGDLKQEITESGTRVKMMEIYKIFPLDFFKDKYMVYVKF
ncbi:MAG: 16S rRNA (guanine(527)-N(7))-methyltransferase RsmG [Chitinophagaceae bacterium]